MAKEYTFKVVDTDTDSGIKEYTTTGRNFQSAIQKLINTVKGLDEDDIVQINSNDI